MDLSREAAIWEIETRTQIQTSEIESKSLTITEMTSSPEIPVRFMLLYVDKSHCLTLYDGTHPQYPCVWSIFIYHLCSKGHNHSENLHKFTAEQFSSQVRRPFTTTWTINSLILHTAELNFTLLNLPTTLQSIDILIPTYSVGEQLVTCNGVRYLNYKIHLIISQYQTIWDLPKSGDF